MKSGNGNGTGSTLLLALVVLGFAGAAVPGARAGLVTREEAVAAADLWYAMELNDEHTRMDPAERLRRIAEVGRRRVLYLVSADELRSTPPAEGAGPVLAYVVLYEPEGFVVVSGEDRIAPVLVFDARGTFRFDRPERNFLRRYLATALVGRWTALRKRLAEGRSVPVHAGWSRLRSRTAGKADLRRAAFWKGGGKAGGRDGRADIYLKLDTPLWDQPWPYNESVVAHNGNIPDIPTGCTATAMAILLRYFEWPPSGYGSHSYTDNKGSVQFSHYVNYGAAVYDWSAMPFGNVTQSNPHVAALMYHCGVAADMDYEVDASGAWVIPGNLAKFFRCWGIVEAGAGQHKGPAIESICAGLPVIMSTSEHTVVVCGYRDYPAPYFYINLGWSGNANGWYNLESIPGGNGNFYPVERSYPYCSPDNWVFVDPDATWPFHGTAKDPLKTIQAGYDAVPEHGRLNIRAGTYTGFANFTFEKPMRLHAYYGAVRIE